MKKLGEVLPDIKNISKQLDIATSMPQPGCSTMDGSKTTQSNNLTPKEEIMEPENPVMETKMTTTCEAKKKLSPEELQRQQQCLSLSESPQSLSQLAYLIDQCHDLLNVYGKKPQQLENIVTGFANILSDYNIQDITDAFKEHLRTSSVMPTPADIVKLIDGEPEEKLSPTEIMKLKYPAIIKDSFHYHLVISGLQNKR